MPEPTVCCVMLTANRPEMARRAVENFRAQTYANRCLFVVDSSSGPLFDPGSLTTQATVSRVIETESIGSLRNWGALGTKADIIIHWDDDDYSHPNRIAEQVALLQSSGADCVGYREMLFWREGLPWMEGATVALDDRSDLWKMNKPGEAWLYSNPDPRYCLGTSLCYWRRTWERKPFEATSQGEDERFTTGLNCVGISANPIDDDPPMHHNEQSRMVARIHAGNTSTAYDPAKMAACQVQGEKWTRVPAWDQFCRSVME